jgi:hypothetical protein
MDSEEEELALNRDRPGPALTGLLCLASGPSEAEPFCAPLRHVVAPPPQISHTQVDTVANAYLSLGSDSQ